MLVIIFPIPVVYRAAISLHYFSATILPVFLPLAFIYRPVEVIEAAYPFYIPTAKRPFIRSNPNEEHKSLSFEVAINECSIIVIAILEVKDAFTPQLIVPPLSLICVAISVVYRAVALLHPLNEVALVSVPVRGQVDTLAVDLVALPEAIVDRTVLEKHLPTT